MRDTQCASNQTDDYLPCPIERVASVHSCVVPTMLNRGKNVGLWTGSKDHNQTTTDKSEPAMPVLPGVEEMSSRLRLSRLYRLVNRWPASSKAPSWSGRAVNVERNAVSTNCESRGEDSATRSCLVGLNNAIIW